MESDPRSGWALGLSLVEVMLLLVFAAMMVYVTDTVEGSGQETQQIVDEPHAAPRDVAEIATRLLAAPPLPGGPPPPLLAL